MENPKYLIIIALIDGQNFTVPDGAPDKIEATVFAEARFGSESMLRSDPIKLINSNPEFVTELAWQLDKKSLHQLRIERKSIKLQVYMQTRERKRTNKNTKSTGGDELISNGFATSSTDCNGETHKVELIGYTILDLRSAQPKDQTKFRWHPLLNPKFRKPSYSRPEIKLAVTISQHDDEDSSAKEDSTNQFSSISTLPEVDLSIENHNSLSASNKSNNFETPPSGSQQGNSSSNQNSDEGTKLYKTCLDTSCMNNDVNQECVYKDEIIDNDIIIRSKDGMVHIYDAKHPHKFTIDDCDEHYRLSITIPFTTNLDLLVKDYSGKFYFFASLFGLAQRTKQFDELTNMQPKSLSFNIKTTHAGVLATYFELKSNLDIKLFKSTAKDNDDIVGQATIQLNQLCSLDTTCRSIEGIFALQSLNHEIDSELSSPFDNPSIGVSVVLEKYDPNQINNKEDESSVNGNLSIVDTKEGFTCDEFEDYFRNGYDTHQLPLDDEYTLHRSLPNNQAYKIVGPKLDNQDNILVEDNNMDGLSADDHHYCFTIDLKEFSYSSSQRLIPTLRELVIRYSYPFFGYKDTITTDASIPINAASSIIVSGFCEFNFATTSQPLFTALSELPLDLEILAADETRLREINDEKSSERLVATCSINLAQLLELDNNNISQLSYKPVSKTALVPIFSLNGSEIGQLQLSLCLKDLGKPAQKFEASIGNPAIPSSSQAVSAEILNNSSSLTTEVKKLDQFIVESKKNFETWKEDSFNKLSDEYRQRDNDRFKRIYQRIEAKEARRDQEFKQKIEDLNELEKKFKNSLGCIASLEKMLVESLEHLKAKKAILNDRLDKMESKISQLNLCNGHESSAEEPTRIVRAKPVPSRLQMQPQRSFDDNLLKKKITEPQQSLAATSQSSIYSNGKSAIDKNGLRRSSFRTTGGSLPLAGPRGQIPVATRGTSLVRRPSEGSTTVSRTARKSSGTSLATVVNELNSRVRSKPILSKENSEKLASLRKEKAELLKRGCKPTDEAVREINSMIEKLAC